MTAPISGGGGGLAKVWPYWLWSTWASADVMKAGKPFKTVIGDISFDKKGDITRPDYVMYVWKKGADGKIDYSGNEMGM